MKAKINSKTVGGLFFLLLIVLILCSRTIYSYNLPEVRAVRPANGRLTKLEISAGSANRTEVERIYAAVGGLCGELLAKEGDVVEAGQPLLRMVYDRNEAERRLREIAAARARQEIDRESILLRLERLDRSLTADGYEIDVLDKEASKARAELEDALALYELGAISLRELEAKQNALDGLLTRRDKTATDYGADKAALLLDLQAALLELESLSLQEEPYRKTLADYEANAVVTAPAGGQLIRLYAQKGARINEDTLLAEIGTGQAFTVECLVSRDNNFILPGDVCELSNTTHVLQGEVADVRPAASGKVVSVSVVSAEVVAGETFDALFEKQSATTWTLVPSGALRQDNEGYFVYQVRRRNGMLGKEYYLERVPVYIGDSDNRNTAILRGITLLEPVALTVNKAAGAGDVVKLVNASDFFVD